MLGFLDKVRKAFPPGESLFTTATLEIRRLDVQAEGQPQTAELKAALRVPPGISCRQAREKLEEAAGKRGKMTVFEETEPFVSEKNTPLVRAFLEGIRGQGLQPGFVKKTGTADMNVFAPHCGNIVSYGPGDSTLDHTENEHLALEEYRKAVRVLKATLAKLGGQ